MQTVENITKQLQESGFKDIKKNTSHSISVLVDGMERRNSLEKIEKILEGATWDKTPSSNSSIGVVRYKKFKIYAKPKNRQGTMSAGLQNEMFLVSQFTKLKNEKYDVEFKNKNNSKDVFLMKDITSVKDVGRDLPKGHKADVVFNGNSPYNISIKQENAEYWSKAESQFGDHAMEKLNDCVGKSSVLLHDCGGYYKAEPGIAWQVPEKFVDELVFGKDSSVVVKATFSEKDFNYCQKLNKVTVNVSDIIRNKDEFDKKTKMYFLLRNDKTRRAKKLLPGLTLSAVSESRVQNKKGVKIL